MMPSLRVAASGLSSTIQDRGREGHQRFGVPVSGALDREALAAANVVVGNHPATAAVECLYQGCTLIVEGADVRCAVAGAGASLEVSAEPGSAPVVTPGLTSVTVPPGGRVRVVMPGPGITSVLAFEGGIAVPEVMGSRSTYVRSGLGGFDGRALRNGDVVPLGKSASGTGERQLPSIDLAPLATVRVVLGPQDQAFTPEALATFLSADYRVGPSSDRMGLRLIGPKLTHVAGADIASDATAWGSIQVPGDGQPIVLLADRQTTGGYTKIATVITADLPALSRSAPGHLVRFAAVTIDEATAAARTRAADMAGWADHLQAVVPALDTERLLRLNLVDGMIDGRG